MNQKVKGVGRAFEKAVTTKGEETQEEGGEKVRKFEFLNKNRQEIFQYLCFHPCAHISMISKATGLSLHATSWHLRRLVEGNYVSKRTFGKKTVFYPLDMIASKDTPILELLNTEKARSIYLLIIERNGLSQGEICEMLGIKHQAVIWYTRKLETLGLLTILEDGKYRRYYPTDLLRRKRNDNAMRLKAFKEKIVKRFQSEMLSPTVLRSTDEKVVVRISRGKSRAEVE